MKSRRVPKLGFYKKTGKGRFVLSGQEHYTKADYGTAAAEAEYRAKIAEWEAAGRRPLKKLRDPSSPKGQLKTLGDLVDLYWADLSERGYGIKGGQKTSTWALLQTTFGRFKDACGRVRLDKVRALDFERFRDVCERRVADKKEIPNTANRRIQRVKQFLRWARRNGHLPSIVVADALLMQPIRVSGHLDTVKARSKPKRAVTYEEADRVASVSNPVYAAMIRVHRLVGMRPGELCGMTIDEIDTEATPDGSLWSFTPTNHKTEHHGHPLTKWVPPDAQEVLRPHLEAAKGRPGGYLWTHGAVAEARGHSLVGDHNWDMDAPIDTKSYLAAVDRGCEQAQVARFTPHELRHGWITDAANNPDNPIAHVARAAGHKNISTTLGYVHSDDAGAQQVVLNTVSRVGE